MIGLFQNELKLENSSQCLSQLKNFATMKKGV